MGKGRLISGLVVMILGLGLIIASLFTSMFLLIYGIPLFVIGVVVILNKKEDKIEKRLDMKGGKG